VPPVTLDDLEYVDTAAYWEKRYAVGLHSGDGSRDELARFKAETLNAFVAEHGVTSVLELGCGDGHQLLLAQYPRYVGLDIAGTAIDLCTQAFAKDTTKSFFRYDPDRFLDGAGVLRGDLALSLDVIFHLVSDAELRRYVDLLFGQAERFVCVYSSDHEEPDIGDHVRHRRITRYIAKAQKGWVLDSTVRNPYRDTNPAAASDFFFYRRKGTA
jgi:SAM-dependent methyltransferase